ncbi:MAG: universal stress protein [Methanomassiliicoccales archaeon]
MVAPAHLGLNSVLVAIDPSKKSVKALEFSFRLLQGNSGGKLYILHAVVPVMLRVSGDAPQTGIMLVERQQEMLNEANNLIRKAVAHAKANGILNVEGIVKEKDPVKAIIETADKLKPDLIVLGNRGRSFRRGIFFGSVSQRVAADSPVSVLIVK